MKMISKMKRFLVILTAAAVIAGTAVPAFAEENADRDEAVTTAMENVTAGEAVTAAEDESEEMKPNEADTEEALPGDEAILETMAVTIPADKVISKFNGTIGGYTSYSGWCLKFVSDIYQQLGYSCPRYGYALEMARAYSLKSGTPAVGAFVFFGTSGYGHVGVWVGDGVVATQGDGTNYVNPVTKKSISKWAEGYGAYRGWVIPSGLTIASGLSVSGLDSLGSYTQGTAHSVAGKISSGYKITSVTAGIYDQAGTKKYAGTAAPNALSYDISKIASSLKFESLAPGMYYYELKAKAGSETKVLRKKYFAVLAKGRTVSDGTYALRSSKNNGFAISVAENANTDGGNFHLWTYSETNKYEQYRIEYQDNGYYKVINVGSGEALSVKGAGSAQKTNIEQITWNNTAGCRWQILPNADGNYTFVPECAKNMAMDLHDGVTEKERNIRLWEIDHTTAQRWKMTKLADPEPEGFKDVQDRSAYYYNPVYMMSDLGIVKGFSDNTFRPQQAVTRGQVVMFLWRMAGCPAPASAKSPFRDVSSGHAYYKAILWANEKGIAAGFSDKTFRPDRNCTRGQIVMFLWRYSGKPAAGSTGSASFTDVPKTHEYFKAVQWAAKKGITTGYTNGKFGVNDTCTRGQCVTFLYRMMTANYQVTLF